MLQLIRTIFMMINTLNRCRNASDRSQRTSERQNGAGDRRRQQEERERQARARLQLSRERERRLREAHEARMGRKRAKGSECRLPICTPELPPTKVAPPRSTREARLSQIQRQSKPKAVKPHLGRFRQWAEEEGAPLATVINQHGKRVCNGCGRAQPNGARFCWAGCGALVSK